MVNGPPTAPIRWRGCVNNVHRRFRHHRPAYLVSPSGRCCDPPRSGRSRDHGGVRLRALGGGHGCVYHDQQLPGQDDLVHGEGWSSGRNPPAHARDGWRGQPLTMPRGESAGHHSAPGAPWFRSWVEHRPRPIRSGTDCVSASRWTASRSRCARRRLAGYIPATERCAVPAPARPGVRVLTNQSLDTPRCSPKGWPPAQESFGPVDALGRAPGAR